MRSIHLMRGVRGEHISRLAGWLAATLAIGACSGEATSGAAKGGSAGQTSVEGGATGTAGLGGRAGEGGSAGVAGAAAGNVGSSPPRAELTPSSAEAIQAVSDARESWTELSECPNWPLGSVLPVVGPFFYGPDPGPCSRFFAGDSMGVTWSYTEGRVRTGVESALIYNYIWEGDRITRVEDQSAQSIVDWLPPYLRITTMDRGSSPQVQGREYYELGASGYPVRVYFESTRDGTGMLRDYYYEYSNCRLVYRTYITDLGTVGERLRYEYDDLGHMIGRTPDSAPGSPSLGGSTERYDYSCW